MYSVFSMGFWNRLFNISNINRGYSSLKQGISDIYHPIKKVTNTLSDYAHKVDNFISQGRRFPVVRDFVDAIQTAYGPALDVVDAINMGVNTAGQAGDALDRTIQDLVGGRQYQSPAPAGDLDNPFIS